MMNLAERISRLERILLIVAGNMNAGMASSELWQAVAELDEALQQPEFKGYGRGVSIDPTY